MKTFYKALLGTFVGLAAVCAFATATYISGTGYTGFNPSTGVEGDRGVVVATNGTPYATTSNSSGPAVPALVVTGTSCAATTPVIGGTLGKAVINTGTGLSTCTYTITNLPTVTTGYVCSGLDVTTPADTIVQSASGVNGCTLTQGTKASGDAVIISVSGV